MSNDPRLQQAIQMLTRDRAGIAEMVAEQLEKNPTLEQIGSPDPGDAVVARVEATLEVRVLADAALRVRTPGPSSIMEPGVGDDDGMGEERRAAEQFIRALDQRAKLIRRVVLYLTKRDPDYFRGDVNAWGEGSVRAAAEALGIHESTIRRIISNKAVDCAHGVKTLEQFFGR